MLKLTPISETDRKLHLKLVKENFKSKLKSATANISPTYNKSLIKYLEKNLKDIALGDPARLESIASEIIQKFPDFSKYTARIKKGNSDKDKNNKNTLEIINKCFDYSSFSNSKDGWGAYALVNAYQLRICPYCQCNHINLHLENDPGASSAGQFRLRPPLDHYLPKFIFPYLAVSLSNLIPSCAQCNSGVKSTGNPHNKVLSHPLDEKPINVKFSSIGTLRKKPSGHVKLEDVALTLEGQNIESTNHIAEFRLQERYYWYRHEVKDLLDRDLKYRDLSPKLQGIIDRELFVLGFFANNAERRSLGFCLRDIYRELLPIQAF